MYINENKLRFYSDRIFAKEKKPITADIFLTDFCNNKCAYCRYANGGRGHMPYRFFVSYAKRLIELGVQGIILTGGGEPTINPDFMKITRWLERKKIPYGVNTNFNKYKKINPTFLKVSLDASSAEEYEQARGVNAFGQVLENIKMAAAETTATLGIQAVIKKPGDAKRFYREHKYLDVNYISFRPLELQNDFYSDRLAAKIIKEVEGLRRKDARVILNYKWRLIGRRYGECKSHWSVISLNHLGFVMYCCHKPDEIVGHVLDKDILKKINSYATDMSLCDNPCRLSASNDYLENMRIEHKEFV